MSRSVLFFGQLGQNRKETLDQIRPFSNCFFFGRETLREKGDTLTNWLFLPIYYAPLSPRSFFIIMPGTFSTTSSFSPSSPSSDEGGATPYRPKDAGPNQHLREDYPAASIPGYAEKPLNEQLEPIAVVGMGALLFIP
jgi:hypothetical protein